MSASPVSSRQARLIKLFGDPDLQWIRQRLRERVIRGSGLKGSITLQNPTLQQTTAFANLLGRPSRNHRQLSLKLASLEALLKEAELAENLEQAVFMLEGELENQRERSQCIQNQWSHLFSKAQAEVDGDPIQSDWLKHLQRSGLLKRLSNSEITRAQLLLKQAINLLQRLPEKNKPLPAVASEITGDSHALDYGAPLAGLLMPVLAKLGALKKWQTPEERRAVWAANGVLCDALSQPILLHNFRLSPSHPLSTVTENGYHSEEPCYLTTRQLIHFPIKSKEDCRFDQVYICENPAIISAAVEIHGKHCHPLICVSGNLTTSAQTLLRQLSLVGIRLHYHGDFDWPGIRIAKFVFEKFGAMPWRMSSDDYCKVTGEKPLPEKPTETPWDPSLKVKMLQRGKIVFEEQVISTLMHDLSKPE